VTGRVLPQDGGLETLSDRLGEGWGQIDIADPSSWVGLVSGSHPSYPRKDREVQPARRRDLGAIETVS